MAAGGVVPTETGVWNASVVDEGSLGADTAPGVVLLAAGMAGAHRRRGHGPPW